MDQNNNQTYTCAFCNATIDNKNNYDHNWISQIHIINSMKASETIYKAKELTQELLDEKDAMIKICNDQIEMYEDQIEMRDNLIELCKDHLKMMIIQFEKSSEERKNIMRAYNNFEEIVPK